MAGLLFATGFDWSAEARARAEVRALLLAKGLREGCGKWGDVFARRMQKRRRSCAA